MSCEIARRMMETGDPALAGHVRSCESCMIGAHARYYEAPPGLDEKIRQTLRREPSAPSAWRWMAIAASLLLGVSLAWNVAQLRSRVDPAQLVADNVLSAHLRSLAGTHLLDVPSSDQHTVKPWFNGKVDFSPGVKDIEGFALVGGRLEYFESHPAAALVYARRGHTINLFLWPSAAPAGGGTQSRNGYHLDHWSSDGMTYWAVSDINQAELAEFVSLYRSNPTGR